MEFKQAAKLAKKGKKIRRKGWSGYWYLEAVDVLHQVWVIHLANGKDLHGGFNSETINNTLANDWEEVK